jgi:hypothetical protein
LDLEGEKVDVEIISSQMRRNKEFVTKMLHSKLHIKCTPNKLAIEPQDNRTPEGSYMLGSH